MAYTLETVKRKGHGNFFETRHSGGYFAKVWGVHPVSDVAGSGASSIKTYAFSPNQVVIEGVSRSRNWHKLFVPIDFFLSQAKLLIMLLSLIRKEKIDLIVATDPFFSGAFGLVLKWLSRRPLTIGIYANYDDMFLNAGALAAPRILPSFRLQNAVAHFILRRADLIMGGTRYYLDWGVAHGADATKGAVVPIARYVEPCHLVDPASRATAESVFVGLGVPTGGRYMIMVSRLIPLKFAEDGVNAMIVAAKADSCSIGIVAGDGPLLTYLKTRVAEAGLTERIRFVGHITQDQLSRILPYCVTLSPLTGMALVECGLGGSPVVAYDADWQPEFIEDGINGFIVPHQDWHAMGTRVAELLGDDKLREQMSRSIRNTAMARADRMAIAKVEADLYERLIGVKP
jgi:glycosyltransferase involved in cell wall biosynthesis